MSTHSWKWHLSSADAWEAMLLACEQAKTAIDFEEFIFVNDPVGERFVSTFIRKAKEGVRIRVLCDSAGSFFFSASQMARRLRDGGVEVKFFNPISPWKVITLKPWAFRDHRKLLVVDRRVAFVGGVCIGEEFARWRDTMVEISGEIAGHLEETFEHMWWATKRQKFTRFKDVRQTEDGFTVITNAPHFRQRFINRTFIDVMRHAKKYIYLTTPYFVPDRKFFRVLRLAARRGVDVRVLLPVRTDHPYVDMASNTHFRKAFKAGIKIFRYQAAMLHAKTLVVDGDWASVGSANIDNLSSFINYELNLASVNKRFAEEVRNQFLGDLSVAKEVDGKTWKNRSIFLKIFELICAPFGRFF